MAQDAPASAGLRSFFIAGFECAAQRRPNGRRLDLLASTGHDRHAAADYALALGHGLRTARDGIRWHLVERSAGSYDWSSVAPMAQAASDMGVQVIWDLCHYGYPDDLDIWSAAFPDRFAKFSAAAARYLTSLSDDVLYFCPVNEMSFWAWAGGDRARFNPATTRRGPELKLQLARAAIAAISAIREVAPTARFIMAEPAIHVAPGGPGPKSRTDAETYRLSQFEAHDMLVGRRNPELGGSASMLDIVGLNFYPDNQWRHGRATIPFGHHDYRPFREILTETYERYRRPLIVSETGAEGTTRPSWLHYVSGEIAAAIDAGVRVEGACLYPVIDYLGWTDNRHCEVGLFGPADTQGARSVYRPLAEELARQTARFASLAAQQDLSTVVPLHCEAS